MAEETRSNKREGGSGDQQGSGAQEGNYKNVETSVGRREDFGDDYAVGEENKISQNEADTEEENNVPNRQRPGS